MIDKKPDECNIKISQLRAICLISELGSISNAAKNLFRTQSAVTRSILDIEFVLNTPLFERHASGMLLTEQGQCVLARAQRALIQLNYIPALLERFKIRESVRHNAEPIWLFNVRRLNIFMRLYYLHHTRSVAIQLDISQPAVSAAIKLLEKGAGLVLFKRSPKGMMPTDAAREIAPYISRALNEIRYIPEDLAAKRGRIEGIIHVGALPLSRTSLLPRAISRLVTAHPEVRIVTNESSYNVLVTELRAGGVDLILGAPRGDEELKDIENEVLFSDELVLLVRTGHPLAGKQQSVEDLSDSQWILPRANTPARHILDQSFKTLGMRLPKPVVESADLAIVRGLLMNSDMIAALSWHQLEYELRAGMLIPLTITLPDTHRNIGISLRRGALHSSATLALIECIRAEVASNE